MSPESILGDAIGRRLAGARARPLVVGVCGAQGSGKSTVAAALAARFANTVVLSLDDLYKTRAERARLARDVHPLFATRGVPGTHDVELGLATFAALDAGAATPLPRFDKARDDRVDPAAWPIAPARPALVIFEGWCVGARPQDAAALAAPVNALERERDPDGLWRRHANAALGGAYQWLFARIDWLAMLRAPSWERVLGWRIEQEHALRATGAHGAGVMSDAEVTTFVSHYERLTRHILVDMPAYADLVLQLDETRACIDVRGADAMTDGGTR
ncbi:AAA family ATPase [Sphingomonas sp. NFR15]|uniref:AAA family ATPase n=1 Tax=Sphingomonas sp. NFR15 TaxID=1566282 RepID=UPI000883A542|nr:AAA family ATPase [Sphingomonas sp. NFR15]SDA25969.1 D-glycerate 3-kinase [Sphingomonas sp. NFR15]